MKRHTLTAALPYTNGPIHIGHLAGVHLPADIYARYLRSQGEEVLFVCGSDEHGVPITLKAEKEGISPQQLVDKYHEMIKKSLDEFGISLDIYSRTSNKTHHETSAEFFKNLDEKGIFETKTTEQFYDPENDKFLADRYIKGTCPKCGNEEAYGDQCEKCGSTLSPDELINPKATTSGAKLIKKATKHWYLPLDKYQEKLEKWILEDHKNWKSNVYGQCKSWLKSGDGLQARAVTRDLNWGVKVPLEDAEGKVLYVWFDAPIGYISATKEWAKANNQDWEKWWKADETRLIHFLGKDNIVFHCIIFPVMLMALGEFILPENVPANEFLNLEDDKLSTSRNWAVWLHEYLEEFPDAQDVLRYVLCANMPETKDNNFTWKNFQERNNNELVGNLGNFINRVLVLTHKYFDGKAPNQNELTKTEEEIIEQIKSFPKKISESLDNFRFREAQGELMKLSALGNEYLAKTEPWHLIKTDEKRTETVLNIALQIVANLAILAEPFLPFTTQKIKNLIHLENLSWKNAGKIDLIPAGNPIEKPKLLFSKIEDKTIENQILKLEATKKSSEEIKLEAQKPEISFDDFTKLDIRIGTILDAEKVPKTKKLLKLKIDTGLDQRTVVSGIAEFYEPEKIIGQQVSILINLAPRKIKGIQSQGMILMATNPDGTLNFVQPKEVLENGSMVS